MSDALLYMGIGFAGIFVLTILYFSVAYWVHWPPFSKSDDDPKNRDSPSSPTSSPSSPTPPPPSPTPPSEPSCDIEACNARLHEKIVDRNEPIHTYTRIADCEHCPPVGYLCFDHCEIWAEEDPKEWETGNHEMYHKCTSETDWCETWKEDGLGWVRGYEGDAAYTRLRHPHT